MKAPSPIAFEILGIEVRWYGVLMAIAVLFAMLVACMRAKKFGFTADRILDYVLIAVPIAFVGARLYYVLFNYSYYEGDILRMINVRAGGLAIHGALLTGLLITIILCKIWKLDVWDFLDLAAPSVAIGQAIGRWGNFFNSEAYGSVTDLPWAIVISGQKVHPTFLYESIWCLLLFFFLIIKNRDFKGQIALLYCIWYSFERFFVEYLRTDSLMLFGRFKQAMVLSAVCFFVCIILYCYKKRIAKKEGKIFAFGSSKYKGKFKR
ncbi:MAG: prolipoprotein diacylglyceryl transferase [Eubacteriales bacterium]